MEVGFLPLSQAGIRRAIWEGGRVGDRLAGMEGDSSSQAVGQCRRKAGVNSPSKWHLIFAKGVRAAGDLELGPGRQVKRVPMEGPQCRPGPSVESTIERPCVSSQAPGQPSSQLHSVWRDSSWHQLQSGTMPGFLSFFFFKEKKI